MRVLVLGTGVTGEAVARFFTEIRAAEVIVADDVGKAGAVDPTTVALDGIDLVVPSPGVFPTHPVLVAAAERGVPVRSEIDVAFEQASAPVVAVTGTNGKTTVTTWIAALLVAGGIEAVTAGNVGAPLLDAVQTDAAVIVAEVSSFQLHFTTAAFRPRVSVILNVADDHLDWHGSAAAYRADKARIAAAQRPEDLLVVNAGDLTAAAIAQARAGPDGPRVARFRVRPGAVDVEGIGAPGLARGVELAARARGAHHDVENAVAAALAALELGATEDGVATGLSGLARLHHRVELVGQAGGVQFYDDSKATNPHATRAAVAGFESVVLIAGGRNKGLQLGSLADLAPKLRTVVAIGEAAAEVRSAFAGMVRVVTADSMRAAVAAAARAAEPGDVVVLSPACASFDWYASYAERGEDFAREVRALDGSAAGP